jgi:putative ABC transport system permease protein
MLSLALRLIAFRPLRYLVALLGISVATGLALIQFGLYRGFRENASVLVDHTAGDLWVCGEHQRNFDFPKPLTEQELDKVRGAPGVAWAYPMLIVFASWKFPDGHTQTVQVVGFDASQTVGGPWRMCAGVPEDLAAPGNVSVDLKTRHKLETPELGTETEIAGIRCRVVALTEGIRSFQGNPIVFTNLDTARAMERLGSDEIHYVIAGLAPGADAKEVLPRLTSIEHVEAYTKGDFALKAQVYWLESTGAGTALAFAALMGLVVGVVVAGQVLYTSTIEHLKEWGTLKAIGATNAQVTMAIVAQAISWALPAHAIAGGLLWAAMSTIEGKGIHPSLDLRTYLLLGLMTVCVCVLASLLSVVRVMRVEPADVFKG